MKKNKRLFVMSLALVLLITAIPVIKWAGNINAPDTSATDVPHNQAVGIRDPGDASFVDENGVDFGYQLQGGGIVITDIITDSTSLSIPAEISSCPVTTVLASAFLSCPDVVSLIIPATVTELEKGFNKNLPNLASYTVDAANLTYSVDTGYGASVLIDKAGTKLIAYAPANSAPAYFSETINTIGDSAFYGSFNLQSVGFTVVGSVGGKAFEDCTALTEVTFSSALTNLPAGCFEGCSSLQVVSAPGNDKYVPNGPALFLYAGTNVILVTAFQGSPDLYKEEGYEIPAGTTSIEAFAFDGAVNLKKVTFNPELKTIGISSFQNTGLTSVTIPSTVAQISDTAFYQCSELEEVVVETSATISMAAFSECPKLTKVTLSDYITEIDMMAFANDTALTDIPMPLSLKTIGEAAFTGCSSLKEVKFGGRLTTISSGAFLLSGVTSFYLPATIQQVDDFALGMPYGIDANGEPYYNEITVKGYSLVNGETGYAKTFTEANDGYVFTDLGEFVTKKGDIDGDGTVSVDEFKQVIRSILGQQAVDDFWLSQQTDKASLDTADYAFTRRDLYQAIINATGGNTAQETTAPAEETTASAEETTAPAEETEAPAEETTETPAE